MLRRWPYTFAVCLSLAVGVAAIVMSVTQDVPLRDPEGFLGPAYVRLPLIGLLFFLAGILPPTLRRAGVWPLSNLRNVPGVFRQILRDEWTWGRVGNIAAGLISFYICYVSYRNLKSALPQVRTHLYDKQLLDLDYFLLFGHNPAPLLHDLLGTGVVAQVLATAYVSYLPLIPLTLGALLVWNKDVSLGAWYATALSLNWVLGTISYYVLPTLGPAFSQPSMFADLPTTAASDLQNSLFRAAARFYDDPAGSSIYGIAGFASLHVSVVVTACLFFQRTGQKAVVRYAGWAFLVMTVLATIYFGWHYLADDVAGAVIGWASVSIGAWATGNRGRRRRRNVRPVEEQDESTPRPGLNDRTLSRRP
ncbi:MAG: phosphatase PAP2 family protein [Aeromicrobium erythreum]